MTYQVGIVISNPAATRNYEIHDALRQLGVSPYIIPIWQIIKKISNSRSTTKYLNLNLFDLDLIFVLGYYTFSVSQLMHRNSILKELEDAGVRIINSTYALDLTKNKAEMLQKLRENNIRIPETYVTESIEEAYKISKNLIPFVLKPIYGYGGKGVRLVTESDRDYLLDLLKHESYIYGNGPLILQQYIKSNFDIRAFVLGGNLIASMKRISPQDDFRTNIHVGGTPQKNNIDLEGIPEKVAKIAKIDFGGIDLIPAEDGTLYTLEVNSTPGWRGLQTVTDFSISARIANWIYAELRK